MEERKLIVPGIYRHFKHTEKGGWNNYIYVTLADTKLITDRRFENFISFWHYDYKVLMKVIETETKNELALIEIDGKVYLIDCLNDVNKTVDYIVYRSLYDNQVYARPKDMFFSKVDKVKYPNVKQKYRMKFLHYIEDDDVTEL